SQATSSGKKRKSGNVNFAGMRRRHGAENDPRARERALQVRMNAYALGQFGSGKIRFVFSLAPDRFRKSCISHPKRNFVRPTAAGKHNRQRRTPASSAKDS